MQTLASRWQTPYLWVPGNPCWMRTRWWPCFVYDWTVAHGIGGLRRRFLPGGAPLSRNLVTSHRGLTFEAEIIQISDATSSFYFIFLKHWHQRKPRKLRCCVRITKMVSWWTDGSKPQSSIWWRSESWDFIGQWIQKSMINPYLQWYFSAKLPFAHPQLEPRDSQFRSPPPVLHNAVCNSVRSCLDGEEDGCFYLYIRGLFQEGCLDDVNRPLRIISDIDI